MAPILLDFFRCERAAEGKLNPGKIRRNGLVDLVQKTGVAPLRPMGSDMSHESAPSPHCGLQALKVEGCRGKLEK